MHQYPPVAYSCRYYMPCLKQLVAFTTLIPYHCRHHHHHRPHLSTLPLSSNFHLPANLSRLLTGNSFFYRMEVRLCLLFLFLCFGWLWSFFFFWMIGLDPLSFRPCCCWLNKGFVLDYMKWLIKFIIGLGMWKVFNLPELKNLDKWMCFNWRIRVSLRRLLLSSSLK